MFSRVQREIFTENVVNSVKSDKYIMSSAPVKDDKSSAPLKQVWNKPTARAYLQIFGTGSDDTSPTIFLFADSQR